MTYNYVQLKLKMTRALEGWGYIRSSIMVLTQASVFPSGSRYFVLRQPWWEDEVSCRNEWHQVACAAPPGWTCWTLVAQFSFLQHFWAFGQDMSRPTEEHRGIKEGASYLPLSREQNIELAEFPQKASDGMRSDRGSFDGAKAGWSYRELFVPRPQGLKLSDSVRPCKM